MSSMPIEHSIQHNPLHWNNAPESQMYIYPQERPTNWLQIDLEGTLSNRDGLVVILQLGMKERKQRLLFGTEDRQIPAMKDL